MLFGKNIKVKLVEECDVNFILSLRNNEYLNKYLSKTDSSIENQIKWIKLYKEREKKGDEFYFKVVDNNSELGLFRLYNIDYKKGELTFGSFIMKKDRPKYAAIESMILAVNYSFDTLGMKKILLDVRKKNTRAKHFYKRFGYKKIYENDIDEFYELSKDIYDNKYKEKYMKLI